MALFIHVPIQGFLYVLELNKNDKFNQTMIQFYMLSKNNVSACSAFLFTLEIYIEVIGFSHDTNSCKAFFLPERGSFSEKQGEYKINKKLVSVFNPILHITSTQKGLCFSLT